MAKILVLDDDLSMVTVLAEILKTQGHEVIPSHTPARAFELFGQRLPDLVLADIEMPAGNPSGLEFLRQVKEFDATVPVIMLTGAGTKARAIAAFRSGAQDFVEKPFNAEELLKRVDNALLQRRGVQALRENVALKHQLQEHYRLENMIGNSPAMQNVYRMVQRVAASDVTVLVRGESGTGKELVARALHTCGRRAAGPFVAVNCAALPEHLLESELFGHRKGSFTGAVFDKVGLFQAAEGGTIFLDEIGSMPLGLQTKLLRVLQEKEVRRVGDTDVLKVDVRVITATNEILEEKIKTKSFREDLYYRVSVIPITLPPLRERVEDIALLCAHFSKQLAQRQGLPVARFSPEAWDAFQAYAWPGNVRELQNAMEHAVTLCDHGEICLKDIPARIVAAPTEQPATSPATTMVRPFQGRKNPAFQT